MNPSLPPSLDPHPLVVEEQSRLNRSTSGQWALYRSHREQLERLLAPPRRGLRLCVLGAGNCNDLDLRWLTEVHGHVQLVDIDADALSRATEFQKVKASSSLHLRGGIDLTGLSDAFARWMKSPPEPEQLAAAANHVRVHGRQLASDLGGPFDAVLSPCLLSQLLTPLRYSGVERLAGSEALSKAIRSAHFQLMLDLLAPDGRGVFACDLLSSFAFADLARTPADGLPSLMRSMLERGKSFAGLDPAAIAPLLKRTGAVDLQPAPPWLWHLSLRKCYLVYAMSFRKGAGARPRDQGLGAVLGAPASGAGDVAGAD